MAGIEESVNKIVQLYTTNKMLPSSVSKTDIANSTEHLVYRDAYEYVSPLEILFAISPESCLSINEVDDCNIYQYPDYYKEEMKRISDFTGDELRFSEIDETWDMEGNVELKFKCNDKAVSLELNTTESRDMVPSVYIEYIHKTLANHRGKYIYKEGNGPNGEIDFFKIPMQLADEIDKIINQFKSSLVNY